MTMLKHLMGAALLAAALGAGACGGGSGNSSSLGRMDGGGGAIPLVDWVTDLATNHNNDTSAPDTVDDKNIADTDNPQAFDPLLQR
jgi:ABC-type glycerol-3-phosphate transport system substrate-binding protein